MGPPATFGGVPAALPVGPGRTTADNAIRATPRQRRRLGANLLRLLGDLQPLNTPLTRPVLSMSSLSLPNRSGSASAASTMASALALVVRCLPPNGDLVESVTLTL